MKTAIELPREVSLILSQLHSAGFEAYIVGGCVRDFLLGLTPHDFDIASAAKPDELKAALSDMKTIDSGIRHGTVTVISGGMAIEVTTFRTDGEYSDRRRPESVSFTDSLTDDLARRDFTINAMAYSESGGICDPFGGQDDLKRRIIRAVGDPTRRFGEDALRIMRAVRFASELSFDIESDTKAAIHSMRGDLAFISAERIYAELTRLLMGDGVTPVLTEFHDVMTEIIPELSPAVGFLQKSRYHKYDVWEHTAAAVGCADKDRIVRTAALFHDIAKPVCATFDSEGHGHFKGHPQRGACMTEEILRRLHADSGTIKQVSELIRLHEFSHGTSAESKLLLGRIGLPLFLRLTALQRADNSAKMSFCLNRIAELERIEAAAIAAVNNGECISLRELAVNGSDLSEIGLRGKEIGDMLDRLLTETVSGRLPNEKNALIAAAKAYSQLT